MSPEHVLFYNSPSSSMDIRKYCLPSKRLIMNNKNCADLKGGGGGDFQKGGGSPPCSIWLLLEIWWPRVYQTL